MAKDLILDVIAKTQSKQLSELATEFDKTANATDDFGKKLNKSTTFSKYLDEELKNTKQRVLELRAEFAKSGDLKIAGDIGGLEKNLKSLQKIRQSMTTEVEQGISQGILDAVKNAPLWAKIGVGAAPILAPALSGALLGALGVGVIGAGIVGQLGSPQVKGALAQFKTDAGATFTEATLPFAGVLTKELAAADALVVKMAPVLTGMFSKAAPAADKLFTGLNGFVEKALPGLNKGLDGAVIIVDELGRDLPAVGKAIGDAFGNMAKGAKGEADALHDLLTVTDQVIVSTGNLIGSSGQLYEQLRNVATLRFDDQTLSWKHLQETFDAFTTGGVGPLVKGILGVGDKSKDAAPAVYQLSNSIDSTGSAAKTTSDALRYLNGELDGLLSKQLSYDQANDKFKTDLLDLKNQLDKNSRSIDDNSLAGLHNRDVLLGMIGDAEKARQAAIDHAGGVNASKAAVDQANASYQASIDQLVGVAAKAGISRDALNKLAGNYQINVLLAIDAIYKSGLAQNVAAHDPGRYGSAGPPKRAAGGPVLAGQAYIVGENHPELFVPDQSGQIMADWTTQSGSTSRGAAAANGALAAASAIRVELAFVGGDSALTSLLTNMARTGKLQISSKAIVN